MQSKRLTQIPTDLAEESTYWIYPFPLLKPWNEVQIRLSFILLFYFTLSNDCGCDGLPLIQKPDSSSSPVRDRSSCAFYHYYYRPLGFINDSDSTHSHTHTSSACIETDTQMHTEKVTSLRHQMPGCVIVFLDRWTLCRGNLLWAFTARLLGGTPRIINLTWRWGSARLHGQLSL